MYRITFHGLMLISILKISQKLEKPGYGSVNTSDLLSSCYVLCMYRMPLHHVISFLSHDCLREVGFMVSVLTETHAHAKSLQSCPALCDPMGCSLPGSSVHGILQTRILECVALPASRASSWPRDQTCVSCISCIGKRILYYWATSMSSFHL